MPNKDGPFLEGMLAEHAAWINSVLVVDAFADSVALDDLDAHGDGVGGVEWSRGLRSDCVAGKGNDVRRFFSAVIARFFRKVEGAMRAVC